MNVLDNVKLFYFLNLIHTRISKEERPPKAVGQYQLKSIHVVLANDTFSYCLVRQYR